MAHLSSDKFTPSNVLPNSKCEGCLHYNRNEGVAEFAICEVGLQPFHCGTVATPNAYQPLTGLATDVPQAQALTQSSRYDAGTKPDVLAMETVYLGEEAANLVKALDKEMTALVRSTCPKCSQVRGTGASTVTDMAKCVCVNITDRDIAKALYRRLPNGVRATTPFHKAVDFVHNVRNNGIAGSEIGKTRSGRAVVAPPEILVKAIDNAALRTRIVDYHFQKSCQGWTPQDHREAASLYIDASVNAVEHGRREDSATYQYLAQRHSELVG